MKFILILTAFVCLQTGASATTTPFLIEGKLTGTLKGKFAYLIIQANSPTQKSSLIQAVVTDNKFVFKGQADITTSDYRTAEIIITDKANVTKSDLYAVRKALNFDARRIILEKHVTVLIADKLQSAEVNGDLANEINDKYERIRITEMSANDSLMAVRRKIWNSTSPDREKIIGEVTQQVYLNQYEAISERAKVLRAYPSSPLAHRWFDIDASINEHNLFGFQELLEESWEKLSPEAQKSAIGKKIRTSLDKEAKEMRLKPGQKIPDYTFTYTDGTTPVSTQGFRGKYLFIDFWTSWCSPCRGEHHYMRQAYEKYKDRNFTILQISLDEKKEKWLKAMKEENLPWLNLHNTKGWDKELETVFNFKSIPTNYLIDPEGNIIGRNLKGYALEKALAKAINQ